MTVTEIHVLYETAIMMTIVHSNLHDKLPVYTMVRASWAYDESFITMTRVVKVIMRKTIQNPWILILSILPHAVLFNK